MVLNADNFIERYPKFSGVTEDIIASTITEAYIFLPEDTYKDPATRDLLAQYVTAHELTLERRDQLEEGLVLKDLKERESNVYTDLWNKDLKNTDIESYYNLTVYGKKFLKLRNACIGVSMFVV